MAIGYRDKLKESDFEFSVLEVCSAKQRKMREQFWINKKEAVKRGYNQSPTSTSPKGVSHSLESRKRMRIGQQRRFNRPEEREKLSIRAKKIMENPETRKKLSISVSKHHEDKEYRRQRSEQMKRQIKANPEAARKNILNMWTNPITRAKLLTHLKQLNENRARKNRAVP